MDEVFEIVLQLSLFAVAIAAWWMVCRLRGVPMSLEESEPGNPSSFMRFSSGVIYMVIGAFAYLIGGFKVLLVAAAVILALVLSISILWTMAQSIRFVFIQRRARQECRLMPVELRTFSERFIANLQMTIIGVPLILFEDGSAFEGRRQ